MKSACFREFRESYATGGGTEREGDANPDASPIFAAGSSSLVPS